MPNTSPENPPTVEEPEDTEILRAKWLLDGATDLAEAADRLEAKAAELRRMHEQGWALAGPVQDDYGFLVAPDPVRG